MPTDVIHIPTSNGKNMKKEVKLLKLYNLQPLEAKSIVGFIRSPEIVAAKKTVLLNAPSTISADALSEIEKASIKPYNILTIGIPEKKTAELVSIFGKEGYYEMTPTADGGAELVGTLSTSPLHIWGALVYEKHPPEEINIDFVASLKFGFSVAPHDATLSMKFRVTRTTAV